jgi:hypothetical protein
MSSQQHRTALRSLNNAQHVNTRAMPAASAIRKKRASSKHLLERPAVPAGSTTTLSSPQPLDSSEQLKNALLLRKGAVFIKYGRRGKPHRTLVWCDESLTCVKWARPIHDDDDDDDDDVNQSSATDHLCSASSLTVPNIKPQQNKSLASMDLRQIREGRQTEIYSRYHSDVDDQLSSLSFSVSIILSLYVLHPYPYRHCHSTPPHPRLTLTLNLSISLPPLR